VRFLVLTSIVVAAATAAAGAQPDALCQIDDGTTDSVVSGPSDKDLDRRPGSTPLVATPVAPIALPAAAVVDTTIQPVVLKDAPASAQIIAFAPKTSPPRARWF
jgi:hypothetical protein